MHFLALVTGEDVHEQLWKFSAHNEVEPHDVFLTGEEIERMAEHYNLPVANLTALAEKMQDWQEEEGFVRDGRIGYVSTSNPNARLDWYQVGGQWEGYLKLKQPRTVRRFFGLLPVGKTLKTSVARKSEIDPQSMFADPPMALVHGGQWYQCEILADSTTIERWKTEFARQFSLIPDETMITVVDVHN